jgi:hypothetical protein
MGRHDCAPATAFCLYVKVCHADISHRATAITVLLFVRTLPHEKNLLISLVILLEYFYRRKIHIFTQILDLFNVTTSWYACLDSGRFQ